MWRLALIAAAWLALAPPAEAGYCSDATPCATNATNAGNLSAGTLPAGRMPALTGDCTTAGGAVATTCTKTNGTSFATSATTDATNAANISSGTLPAARLPGYVLSVSSGGVATTAASTQYIGNAISTTESAVRLTSPYTGTLKSIYCNTSAAPGAGKTYTITSMVNGSAGTLTFTITGTSATSGNDTAHSDAITAGQTYSVRVVGVTSITTAQISCGLQLQ